MEDGQEILLSSLEQFGVSLPTGVSSICEMAPSALISICSQSLNLIDSSVSFPTSLPDSTTERIDMCTKITSSVKALGYRGDLSFHQFLYLSSVDAYNLVRFLVERLSRLSGNIKLDGERVVVSRYKKKEYCSDVIEDPLRGWTKRTDVHEAAQTSQTDLVKSSSLKIGGSENEYEERVAPSMICHKNASAEIDPSAMEFDKLRLSNTVRLVDGSSSAQQLDQSMLQSCEQGRVSSAEENIRQKEKLLEEVEETKVQVPMRRIPENQEDDIFVPQNDKSTFLPEKSSMFQEKDLNQGMGGEKSTMEVAFGDQSHAEFMEKKPGVKEDSLLEVQLEWDTFLLTLEGTKKSLMLSGLSEKPEVQQKLRQLDEIGDEIVDMMSRIMKREEECSKLSMELEKQPRMAPRSYYIQRITELSKNSWKQDRDIKQITKDTWQLQLEINSIQERLGRTYAVVEDAVFRDAKKDPVRKQAYLLLVGIHESFSQIADTILAIDRVKREASDYEAKLASLSSTYFGVDKLEADLNSLQKENELLEKQIL
ncbi:unnamed protein product [Victoria cruziana]